MNGARMLRLGVWIAIGGVLLWLALFMTLPPWRSRDEKLLNMQHSELPPAKQETLAPRKIELKTISAEYYSITLLPVDRDMPTNVVINKGVGPPEELSQSSREKTVHAITNFITNAKRAGLKFNPGDLVKPIRVRTMVNSSATAQTEHAVFGVQFSPSGDVPPLVDHITSIGTDENGANRDVNSLTPGGHSLETFSDKDLYPIKSSPQEVQSAVENFLTLQIPNGNYALNDTYRLQAPLPLPFLVYEFVPSEEYKKADPISAVKITVRDGGTDLQPGEVELIAYEDAGVVNRAKGWKRAFPKPSVSALGR